MTTIKTARQSFTTDTTPALVEASMLPLSNLRPTQSKNCPPSRAPSNNAFLNTVVNDNDTAPKGDPFDPGVINPEQEPDLSLLAC